MTTPKMLLVGLGSALLLLWAGIGLTNSLFLAMIVMAIINPQAMVQRDLLTRPVLLRKATILGTVVGGYFLIQYIRG